MKKQEDYLNFLERWKLNSKTLVLTIDRLDNDDPLDVEIYTIKRKVKSPRWSKSLFHKEFETSKTHIKETL